MPQGFQSRRMERLVDNHDLWESLEIAHYLDQRDLARFFGCSRLLWYSLAKSLPSLRAFDMLMCSSTSPPVRNYWDRVRQTLQHHGKTLKIIRIYIRRLWCSELPWQMIHMFAPHVQKVTIGTQRLFKHPVLFFVKVFLDEDHGMWPRDLEDVEFTHVDFTDPALGSGEGFRFPLPRWPRTFTFVHMIQLRRLALSWCNLSDVRVLAIMTWADRLRYLPRLETLELVNCKWSQRGIGALLWGLGAGRSDLDILTLPPLRSMTLVPRNTGDIISIVDAISVVNLLPKLTSLTRLTLRLSALSVKTLLDHASSPSLEELVLVDSEPAYHLVTDTEGQWTSRFPKLTSVRAVDAS